MILADLDRELAARIAVLVADGTLPRQALGIAPGRTWRPAPDGDPASFATSVTFELAALSDCEPADIAAQLAAPLAQLPWVALAEPAGTGYLTIAVTAVALGHAAARLAAAGPTAGQSTILASTTAAVPPWPNLAAAADWRHAWRDHAAAVTGRLAAHAGAEVTAIMGGERGASAADAVGTQRSAVAAAVAWYGVPSIRYSLARTAPGQVARLGLVPRPGASGVDPLYPVRQAYKSAMSVQRWAADLGLAADDLVEHAGDLLCSPAERKLLGLLPWFPVRVAMAARRRRPDELPGYLEAVGAAWRTVGQLAPALPFGGRAAAADPATRAARLVLARAVHAVLAAGLALTGASPCTGDD